MSSAESSIVLDTDIVSYLHKQDPLPQPIQEVLRNNSLMISFMTVAELRYGAAWRHWGTKRRANLEATIDRFVMIPPSDPIISRWASLCAHGRRIGRPVGHGDAWIAATALELGFPLLTNNRRHYEEIPHLQLIPST